METLCNHLCEISPPLLRSLVDTAAKGAAILLLTLIVTLAMRRASAAARHLVWFLGAISLLILPILSAALPGWHILPDWSGKQAAVVQQPPAPIVLSTPAPALAPAVPDTQLLPNYAPPQPAVAAPPPLTPVPAPISVPAQSPLPHLNWQAWTLLAWVVGSLLYFAYVLLGCASLWRLGRRSSHISTDGWLTLLSHVRRQLSFHRPVELVASPRRAMPMTWGLLRTWILLPDDSSYWTESQRRAVLLHELAHAKRLDSLTQLITHLACALYWFNPLIWLAWTRMQSEREQACDDLVLSTGTKASAYAEQLLKIASEMPPVRFSAAAIAMARPSTLEGRLLAILDVKRNRRTMTWGGAIAAVILIGAFAVPLSILRGAEPNTLTTAKEPQPKANPQSPPVPAGFGEVVDAQGKPISGAILHSHKSDWAATTGADGLFSLASFPVQQTQSLMVTAPGFVVRNTAPVQPDRLGRLNPSSKIDLHRPAHIEGRVLGLDGQPLADAKVSVDVRESYLSYMNIAGGVAHAISDARGQFAIGNIPPGQIVLSCATGDSKPTEARAAMMEMTLDDGQSLQNLVLDLSKSIATVDGRVVDKEGKPLSGIGVKLACSWTEGIPSQAGATATTDSAGRYQLQRLPMGSWRLSVNAGTAWADVPVTLSAVPAHASDLVLAVIRTASGRLRRARPMEGSDTVQEWIDAARAADSAGARAMVSPDSNFDRNNDRITPFLPQLKLSGNSSWSTLGNGEVKADAVTLANGYRTPVKFILYGKQGYWYISDLVAENGASLVADSVATQPATQPVSAATAPVPSAPAITVGNSAWRAKLPCGATVELVGVTEHSPAEKPFWRPDGSPLAAPPDHYPDRAKLNVLKLKQPASDFVIVVSGLRFAREQGDYQALTHIDPQPAPQGPFGVTAAVWTASILPPKDTPDGSLFSDVYVLSQSFAQSTDRANVRFGLAAGPWETVATDKIDGRDGAATSLRGVGGTDLDVSFERPYVAAFEEGMPPTVHITVAHNIQTEHQVRVIAILTDGRETVCADPTISTGHVQQITQSLRRGPGAREQDMVAIADVKEFRLQSRPLQWAEFKNISIQAITEAPRAFSPSAHLDDWAVNKTLADYPEAADLSTPQRAWVAYQRATVRQDSKTIAAMSAVKIDPELADRWWADQRKNDPEGTDIYIKALKESRLVQLWIYHDEIASTVSYLPFPPGKGADPYSVRCFGLVGHEWKNLGEDRLPSLEAAGENVKAKQDNIWQQLREIKAANQAATPPAFRPKVALRFGPVMERTILEPHEPRDTFLDLGSGTLLKGPVPADNSLSPSGAEIDWAKRSNADLRCLLYNPHSPDTFGLVLLDSALSGWSDADWSKGPSSQADWDQTPEALLASLHGPHMVDENVRPWGHFPRTIGFDTREGNIGLLQIMEVTENPKGVRLRYKLVQNDQPASQPAATQPAAVPAIGLVSVAESLVDDMAHKQFAEVVKLFGPEMTKACPPEKLAAVWQQLEQAGGKYLGRGDSRSVREAGFAVVYVPTRWEHNAIDMKVVFDDAGRVSGLWTVAPQATTQPVAMATDREPLYQRIAQIDRIMANYLDHREAASTQVDDLLARGLGKNNPMFVAAQQQLKDSQQRVSDYADQFMLKNSNFLLSRHFVQVVIAPDGAMSFQGAATDWDKLPALLEQVPERGRTVLCLGVSSDKMTVGQYHEAMGRLGKLVSQFGFEYLSDVGQQPLGSKGAADQPLPDISELVRSAVTTISTCTAGDPKVAKAMATLNGIDDPAVVAETTKYLASEDGNTRRAAIYVLWNGGFRSIDPAVAPLMQLCKHKEDLTRGMAALALGANHVADSKAALMLIEMVGTDKSGYARRCAAYALGLLGDRDALPTLEKASNDPDPMVADNAKAAIRMLNAKPAEPARN